MIRFLFLISISSLFSLFVHSQDLALSVGLTSNSSVGLLEHVNLKIRVKNIGTANAGKSHTSIYISNTQSFSNAILLSIISCEALAAGQETSDIDFVYPIPANCTLGTNYILIDVDSGNEVSESNENNEFIFTPTVTINSTSRGQQNLPYPVILMHGLSGQDTTWFPFIRDVQKYFGYSYGGNFDFCLNQDGNDNSANLIQDVKDWTDTFRIGKGDFYTVNFDIDNFGNKYVNESKSNQSAIVKQGYAMSSVIKQVLAKTGRDKVILAGHSMGGLACREYLQNTVRWQIDGKHHVAKLLTNGTPNGGSNSTSFGLGAGGIDEKSEAVRDLRRDYYISGDKGVYLFGGVETYSSINNNLFFNYKNVDVNCDGINNNGSLIIGLNNKSFPTDISYASIVGEDPSTLICGATSEKCDGIVNITSANINNYLNVKADTFYCVKSGSSQFKPLHTELPKQTDYMFKGLDESNEYNTGYKIDTGKIYFANFSTQSLTGYQYDYDDYKITIPKNGLLSCKLYNIPINKCYFKLLDASQTVIYTDSTNGQGYYEFKKIVTPGDYFIEFYARPESYSWQFPYALKISIGCQTAVISPVGNIVTCSPNLPLLTSNSNTGNQWYLNNTIITAANSNSYTPTISGTYSLITTINGCVSNPSAPVSVVINQSPLASVTPSDTLQICSGSSSKLSANTGTGLTYQWRFNGSNISTAISSSYLATQAGVYNALITNSAGCSVLSNSTTIVINSIPTTPIITLSGSSTFCSGGSLTMNSSSVNGNQWYKDGIQIVGANGISYISSSTGIYTDTIVNSKGCKSGSLPIIVTVKAAPIKPYIIWNGSTLSTNSLATSFQWSVNNVPLFGATASNYKPLTFGFYKIQITNSEGCNNTSDSFNLVVTSLNNSSITDVNKLARIFPNPVSRVLLVKFNEAPSSTLEIRLISNDGKIVKLLKIKNKLTAISINNYPSGNYFIRITGNNYNQTEGVIISK